MKEAATATKDRPQGRTGPSGARRLRLAGDAGSVRAARHLVEEALAACPSEVRDTAVLLADEVTTNAVVHGGGWFLLQIDVAHDRLRVEVTDSSPGRPRVLRLTGEREHGRGMAIVDALASEWGTEHLGTHKVVWFELAIPR